MSKHQHNDFEDEEVIGDPPEPIHYPTPEELDREAEDFDEDDDDFPFDEQVEL